MTNHFHPFPKQPGSEDLDKPKQLNRPADPTREINPRDVVTWCHVRSAVTNCSSYCVQPILHLLKIHSNRYTPSHKKTVMVKNFYLHTTCCYPSEIQTTKY